MSQKVNIQTTNFETNDNQMDIINTQVLVNLWFLSVSVQTLQKITKEEDSIEVLN